VDVLFRCCGRSIVEPRAGLTVCKEDHQRENHELKEEKATDAALTTLAKSVVNVEAEQAL
jgi:hypothetical protein